VLGKRYCWRLRHNETRRLVLSTRVLVRWSFCFIEGFESGPHTGCMNELHGPYPEFINSPTSAKELRYPAFPRGGAGVAVALGGGFSRGFAHLGVLDVLKQEQIPVAVIVGASIGSLLGAAYAEGVPIQTLCELGRQVRIREFIRPRHPHPAAGTKDQIGKFVSDWFRSRYVEELPIPTAIVATDLDSGAPHIFTRGPLDVAIRASCAFPGLFKPVEHEGRMLADGCIVAPVPTEVAACMTADCVLGVMVDANRNKPTSPDSIVQVFSNPLMAAQKPASPSWMTRADVLLEPEVHHIDWHDFSCVDEAYAAGKDAMRRALPVLRELLALRSGQKFAAGMPGHTQPRRVSR
jgi:NTE family protein